MSWSRQNRGSERYGEEKEGQRGQGETVRVRRMNRDGEERLRDSSETVKGRLVRIKDG